MCATSWLQRFNTQYYIPFKVQGENIKLESAPTNLFRNFSNPKDSTLGLLSLSWVSLATGTTVSVNYNLKKEFCDTVSQVFVEKPITSIWSITATPWKWP